MLWLSIRRIKPEKEVRLRVWLSELNRRADEVRATFEAETVRAEQAYIIPTSDGPLLVYAMEAEDFDRGQRQAFADSRHAIDLTNIGLCCESAWMSSLELRPIYDVSAS